MDVKYVQAEIQVLAQVSIGDGLLGVLIGGGEHAPHVGSGVSTLAAEPPDFVIFQHAKLISPGWHPYILADFVQQQRVPP